MNLAADLVVRGAVAGSAVGPDGLLRVHEGRVAPGDFRPVRGCLNVDVNNLLVPGFVDCHTHFLFAGDRANEFGMRLTGKTYQEIAAAGGGIRKTVAATRAATDEELAANLERHLDRALLDGTTTVEVKVSYGLDLDQDLRGLAIVKKVADRHPVRVIPTWMGAHEFPDEYRDRRDAFVDRIIEWIPVVADQGIADFFDVFVEEGVFTLEQGRRLLAAAGEAGFGLKVHADEFGASGGSDLAIEFGATSADHLHGLPERNIEGLLKAGVVPVALPGTSFFLRMTQHAPARKMLEAGLPLAIATDGNPGSNMTESMPMMLTLACLQYGLTPEESFRAATVNAAAALGLEDEVGTLEPGFFADFQVLDVPSLDHLAYHYGRSHVRAVYVGGVKVVEDGRRIV